MTKTQVTVILWEENFEGIKSDFPDDWSSNKNGLINEMIDYCLNNGFKASKPLLRQLREKMESLEDDIKLLKAFCRLEA